MTEQAEPTTGLNELIGAGRARITEMKEVSRLSDVEFEAHRVVHPLTRNKATLAQFNDLLQQLSTRREGGKFVVGISGLVRGAGASYVAMNLAAALAADYRRTALLIQCNPYPTALHRMLVPFPEIGLTDYLADERMHIDDIVYAPGVARMRVIPYGNEALEPQLLGGPRMAELVRAARALQRPLHRAGPARGAGALERAPAARLGGQHGAGGALRHGAHARGARGHRPDRRRAARGTGHEQGAGMKPAATNPPQACANSR